MLTHVRAFAIKSVAIGGDSAVDVDDGCLAVGPERRGPPLCLGGGGPTPTDALRVLGKSSVGDLEKAKEAMAGVAGKMGCSIEEAAGMVVDLVVEKIASEIDEMFLEWEPPRRRPDGCNLDCARACPCSQCHRRCRCPADNYPQPSY